VARPRVSILLLTRNGADTLPQVLDAIARQRAPFDVETVAVDSGSTDGTLHVLEGRVARLLRIPPETFNHGGTRNLAVAATTGSLVVLLVQDAVPAGDTWLARLVEPLVADEGLAGTFARQRPRADASVLTRHYLAGWLGASDKARTNALLGREELEALAPMQRYERCVFDNVCSCIRRTAWEQHPFPVTDIAEDVEWARNVLLAGYRLAYVPESVVVHSHDRSARYELGRTYLIHRRLRALFGLRTVPTALHLLRAIASSLVLHLRLLTAARVTSPAQVARAVALAFAFPLGQYLGAVSADTGWRLLRPRGV
jgi:rhamnosyltransferase